MLLSLPDSTVAQGLALHLHLLLVSVYVVCEFLIRPVDERLNLIFANLVDQFNGLMLIRSVLDESLN